MPFEKGTSGNPGGRGKGTPWRDALIRAVNRRKGKKDLKGLDDAADALLDAAAAWNVVAARELGDRLDGKSPQALEHSGVIATTHEEYLKQLDGMHDADGEENTAPAA